MDKKQNEKKQFSWKTKRLKKPLSECSWYEIDSLFAKKEESEIGYSSYVI